MPFREVTWRTGWNFIGLQAAAALAYALFATLLAWCLPTPHQGGMQLGLPLALALLLRLGGRVWPGLALAMLWLAWREPGLLAADRSLLALSCLAAALLGANLPPRRRLPFYRLTDVLAFLAGAVGLASLLAALGRVFALLPAYRHALTELAWLGARMWLGNAVLLLTVTPVLLLAGRGARNGPGTACWRETSLVAGVTLLLAALVCCGLHGQGGHYAILPYLFIMPLLWLAFRSELRLAHGLSLAIVALALTGVRLGVGALAIATPEESLLNVALLALVQSVTLLVFGALLDERRQVERRLLLANQSLEAKVGERTRQLAESESRLRLMADAAPFPLTMNRLAGGELIYANERAEELFGASLRPERALRVQDFYVHAGEREEVAQALRVRGRVEDKEVRLKDAQGREFWAQISCATVKSDKTWYVINGVNDISERKRLEQSLQDANTALRRQVDEIELLQQGLREQALRDPLTGLFNRRHLDEILPRVLDHMLALHRDVAVLMVDADHFKRVNDTYGHRCGDVVLTALGAYLSDHFRSGDIVCRYGGEEFFVLLPGASLEAAFVKAQKLCETVRQMEIEALGHTLSVTLSIGLALCPLHGEDAESVVLAADEALYQAKQQGRDRVCVAAPLQTLLS
ncbi:sensor domain-containing diguanylate cyclase [Chromobacterium paludis]|uniref:diguanylate cyclase n=1 Tax=Chromobacterium paludis TaxID=2605945 RepID=A0A5C1DKA5_9NEIS|nr:diguanylate cyclase [Chromobacterium paludis]QEL57082.1 diguanylate cyclase [Chromobacterium paludis]